MSFIEDELRQKKEEISRLNVPNEFESRIRQAVYNGRSRSKVRKFAIGAVAAAVLCVFILIGLQQQGMIFQKPSTDIKNLQSAGQDSQPEVEKDVAEEQKPETKQEDTQKETQEDNQEDTQKDVQEDNQKDVQENKQKDNEEDKPAAKAKEITEEDLQLGKIKVNMTVKQVTDILGKPSKQEKMDIEGINAETYLYEDLEIFFTEGEVYHVVTTSDKYATPRGLKVGDTVEALKDKYGEPAEKYDEGLWIYQFHGYDLFQVRVKDGKVTEIKVSLVM